MVEILKFSPASVKDACGSSGGKCSKWYPPGWFDGASLTDTDRGESDAGAFPTRPCWYG